MARSGPLSPPQERPSSSPSRARTSTSGLRPLSGTSGMLMRPDHAGVDRDDPLEVADGVVFDDHPLEDLVPGAVLGTQPQPLTRGLLGAIVFGQVTPRSAGAQLRQDRVDHLPVITPSPTTALPRRQQRLDHRSRLLNAR